MAVGHDKDKHRPHDDGWVYVDMEGYSQARSPQYNSSNVSSVQAAIVTADAASDGGTPLRMSHMDISGSGDDREDNYIPDHPPPSNTETCNTDMTPRGDNGDRLQAIALEGAHRPPPIESPSLTRFALELHARQVSSYTPGDIMGWVAEATPPYSRRQASSPLAGSVAVGKRSKTSSMTVESSLRGMTRGREERTRAVMHTGAWSHDHRLDPNAYDDDDEELGEQ